MRQMSIKPSRKSVKYNKKLQFYLNLCLNINGKVGKKEEGPLFGQGPLFGIIRYFVLNKKIKPSIAHLSYPQQKIPRAFQTSYCIFLFKVANVFQKKNIKKL